MRTLAPEASLQCMHKYLHLTINCEMQLLIHALNTCICICNQTFHIIYGNVLDKNHRNELKKYIRLYRETVTFQREYWFNWLHAVIMSAMASQIISLTIVYSTVYSGADQRKHQSPASLAFVGGIHWWPVNSQHKWPVTRKMFTFDDVIMCMSNFVPVSFLSRDPESGNCRLRGQTSYLSLTNEAGKLQAYRTRPREYRQPSILRCTKSSNLNVSRAVLQLPFPNPLKPGVKSRMKM